MIQDVNGKERYSISTNYYSVIKRLQTKIHKEDSMVLGILFGDVGSGKSIAAQHMGHAVDKTLHIDRVCFDKEEFTTAIINNRKCVIIGDEGINLFFSRSSMTKEGRLMSELMDQIRQKNLCVLICVPKLLTMDWTVLDSANFVAYVWESSKIINGTRRTIKGNMAFYPKIEGDNYKDKIIDYLKKKRRNPMKFLYKPEPFFIQPGNPIGESFKDVWYPVGKEKYIPKKEAILKKYIKVDGELEKKKTEQTMVRVAQDKRIVHMRDTLKYTWPKIREIEKLSTQTLYARYVATNKANTA